MSTVSTTHATTSAQGESASRSTVLFAGIIATIAVVTCLIAGWAPLGFSIATVFLFAGPHNWLEVRYFLTKMPGRWGKLWFYFTFGLGGVFVLTSALIAMRVAFRFGVLDAHLWSIGTASWNTLFVVWVVALMLLRARQNPRRPLWEMAIPIGLVFIALTWLWPVAWNLGLVYAHPLVALAFLDRELGRRNRDWQRAYRWCLPLVPVMLVALWWRLAHAPNLPGDDILTMQITGHAGMGIINGVSTHLLVSTHTFLEMLHYAVWVFAIPLVAVRSAPWKLKNVPLMKRSLSWRVGIVATVALGALIVLAMWSAFLVDYPLTRDIYFTLALTHVLAEVPFLLRLL